MAKRVEKNTQTKHLKPSNKTMLSQGQMKMFNPQPYSTLLQMFSKHGQKLEENNKTNLKKKKKRKV